jgi:hypothetical protein
MSAIGVASARNGALAGLGSAGVDQHSYHDEPSVMLSGSNGSDGAGMTLAMVDNSFGATSASATNEWMTSGVAGKISIPPTIVSTSCSRVCAGGQARLSPRGALFGIDVQRLHVRKIEHDPPVRDDERDLGRVRGPDDDRRPAVDPAVEDGTRLVVPGVVRRDHPTVEGGAQLAE